MAVRLKYGIGESGKVLHINDVERGVACKCKCPECESELIARKGNKNQFHFSHSNGMECKTAPETAIHFLAKEIINENSEIYLDKQSIFKYSKCEIEKKYHSKRPDATIINDDKTIFVEIVVTNDVSHEKEIFFKESRNKALVIDLKKVDREIEKNELEEEVLANCEIRRIILNEEKEGIVENSQVESHSLDWLIKTVIGIILFIFLSKAARSSFNTKKRYSKIKKRKKSST